MTKYCLVKDDEHEMIITEEVAEERWRKGELSSKGRGYDSVEALKKEEDVIVCSICGDSAGTHYCEPTKREMKKKRWCFACHFWMTHVEHKEDKESLRIGGMHYRAEQSGTFPFRGFGGSEFIIKRIPSGEVFTCNNLWHQGEIPKRFRTLLPDNAEFVKRVGTVATAQPPGF